MPSNPQSVVIQVLLNDSGVSALGCITQAQNLLLFKRGGHMMRSDWSEVM